MAPPARATRRPELVVAVWKLPSRLTLEQTISSGAPKGLELVGLSRASPCFKPILFPHITTSADVDETCHPPMRTESGKNNCQSPN